MAVTNMILVKALNLTDLATLVNEQLALGKTPHGPPILDTTQGHPKWVQALVTDSEIEERETDVITVTTGQLLALNTTPVTLIAAPGAGKAIVPVSATLFLDYAGVAYDGIAAGEDLAVRATDGSGAIALTVEATGFLDATADAHREAINTGLFVPVANAALVLHMTTGNIATGTSPLKLRVRYRVVDLLT